MSWKGSGCQLLSWVQLFVTPWTLAHQASLSMNSPGKNTGMGCHFLLQGIFLIQGLNLSLLRCRQILYHLNHQGSHAGFFFFLIGKQLINNGVLVSGIQQSDSVIHIDASILFQILFPFRLLENTEQSSLCYTVGPSWLFIFNTRSVCMSIPNSQSIPLLHPFPQGS